MRLVSATELLGRSRVSHRSLDGRRRELVGAGVTQEPILANDAAQSWQAHHHAAAGERVWLRLVVGLR